MDANANPDLAGTEANARYSCGTPISFSRLQQTTLNYGRSITYTCAQLRLLFLYYHRLTEMTERTHNPLVGGSNPSGPTIESIAYIDIVKTKKETLEILW